MTRKALSLRNNYTLDDIFEAYLSCRKNKRTKTQPKIFELFFERDLIQLLEEINNETYEIGRTHLFAVHHPKPREVWAAQFRDRVVHHLVYADLQLYFEKYFIHDTYSCINGRGSLAAVKRSAQFARQQTKNYDKNVKAYFLKMDIANYFVSINRSTLWELLLRHINEKSLTSRILYKIIFNDFSSNPIIKPNEDFSDIPYHKRLVNAKPDCGLPIGNLTSQFFGNLYMDKIDKYIKHTLKIKRYVRYVDDLILFDNDVSKLKETSSAISELAKKELHLDFHPNKTIINSVHNSFDFCGATVKPFHTRIKPFTQKIFTKD